MQIYGLQDATQRLPQIFQWSSAIINHQTIQYENCRAIVKGNLALAAIQMTFQLVQGRTIMYVEIVFLARENGRWNFVANLPLLDVDIGLDLPQPP